MITTLVMLCMSRLALADVGSTEDNPRLWYLQIHAKAYFEQFIQRYNRKYVDKLEKQARLEIFKKNLDKINTLHLRSLHADYGVTKFSDISREEFNSKFNGLGGFGNLNFTETCEYLGDENIFDKDAPESFDWREYGVVTPVKDQGACGSDFAFSAIGNIESQSAIKNKNLVRLSEQQILDCDKRDAGCSGGFMHTAIRSLINQGGSESEADYPYQGRVNTCNFHAKKVKVKINNCQAFNLTSQHKLKQLLYHTGPIAIGVQGTSLQLYTGGIIPDVNCDVGEINHGVLLVGYGSEKGTPYWIVKNSWGTSFGEDGYFRMDRGENATSCGVMNEYMASATLV